MRARRCSAPEAGASSTQKAITQSLALLAALAATMAVAALPAQAKHVQAKSLHYKNNGAYTAELQVEYKREFEGKTVTCRVTTDAKMGVVTGTSRNINLTSSNLTFKTGSAKACFTDSNTIPVGIEVWGYVRIKNGENQSCRKSTRIILSPSGGEVKYRTGGTTLNNNRCKVSSWPS